MTSRQRRKYYQEYDRANRKAEGFAYRVFLGVLTKQIKAVIDAIEKTGVANEMTVDVVVQEKQIETAMVKIFDHVGGMFRDFVKERLPKQKRLIDPSMVVGFMSGGFSGMMRDYALTQAGSHIKQINTTTKNNIKQALKEGADQFLGAKEIAKLVKQKTGGVILKNRALLIARTETTAAANYAQFVTAQEFGTTLKKEWVSTNDGRTRDWHRSMDGKQVEMNEDFMVDGLPMKYPGDSRGGAKNVCNCRCTVAYIPQFEPEIQRPRASILKPLITALAIEQLTE